MKFVDQIRVQAKAGDGGNGCSSFRREKFVPRGGPDGGDGGDGGDIILQADPHTDNLVSLYYEPIIRAKKGGNGMGKDKHGKSAHHTIVRVPVGTIVYPLPDKFIPSAPDPESDDFAPEEKVKSKLDIRSLEPIADLAEPGQQFILCKGGNGGKGNTHFKSSVNRVPRRYTEGRPGEEGGFLLELRTIADAGLVGYPNAGKSTLISRLSAAHPKVAPYPFTTLHPIVGIMQVSDYRRASVADIPGLIAGAHENKGLGHEFLRHIVRCKLLLMVLDMAGSEGRDPISDYQTLRKELRLYDPLLAKRPSCIIANKMDLPEAAEHLVQFKQKYPKLKVIPISAQENTGIEEIYKYVFKKLDS